MGCKGMFFPETDPGWWKNIDKNEERQSEEIKYDVQETGEVIKTSINVCVPEQSSGFICEDARLIGP